MQGEGVDEKAAGGAEDVAGDASFPQPSGSCDGADVGVTGPTATERDSNSQMRHAAPYVFGFVLTLAFLLMLLTFRSIVIAIKAVVLNLLSVAAAYGVLVLVFQHGWGKGLLGFSVTPEGSSVSCRSSCSSSSSASRWTTTSSSSAASARRSTAA